MPFRQGAISYCRFAVQHGFPEQADDKAFALMRKHMVKSGALSAEGTASGWCTGRHVFDAEFTWEECGFPGQLLCAMRVDTAKVPAEIRRAYVAQACEARTTKSGDGAKGFVSGAARKDAREEADRRCTEEIKEGKYRRVAMVPVLMDLAQHVVLAPITSDSALSELRGLVEATFGGKLQRRSAGGVAADMLGARGMTSDLEDAMPDTFTQPPAEALARGGDEERPARTTGRPDVPWAMAGGDRADFLGNVFLLWLWWHAEAREGVVEVSGTPIAVVIDRVIDLECPWGVTGTSSLRGELPTRTQEAAKALQTGKWPRRVGLLLAAHGLEFSCTLQGDKFQVTALKLGQPSEAARTPRLDLEERLDRLATFDQVLCSLYEHFLRERFASSWPTRRQQISEWINSRSAVRAAS
ncbi:MAG: hypothetical protein JNK53_00545 [Phycisphaerae bacterium]|nr:hypothetical protein [Phycisphaerae bacterium]